MPTSIDVEAFFEAHGVPLGPEASSPLRGMNESQQAEYLVDQGVDPELLKGDIEARPMPIVAAILEALEPSAPRPEIASDEDYRRRDRDLKAMAIIEDLDRRFGQRVGFLRWDEKPDGSSELVVPLVGITNEDRADLDGKPIADRSSVKAVNAVASRAGLSRMKQALARELHHQIDQAGLQLGSWSIGVDVRESRLVVRISEPKSEGATVEIIDRVLERLLAGEIGRGSVRGDAVARDLFFVDVASMEPPDVDFRESAHIRGGEWAAADNSGGACTTNFLWKRSSSDYRMGTAGHCSTANGQWHNPRAFRAFDHMKLNGVRNGGIGTVTLNGWTNGSRSDYALMTLPWAATGTSRVMTTGTTWRTIKAVVAENSVGGPWTWCHVGRGLVTVHGVNKSCGTITHTDIEFTYNVDGGQTLTIAGLYCIDALRAGGDSGGSVYYEIGDDAWAVGIHHGSGNTGDACFTTIQASTNRHGYTVVTS